MKHKHTGLLIIDDPLPGTKPTEEQWEEFTKFLGKRVIPEVPKNKTQEV